MTTKNLTYYPTRRHQNNIGTWLLAHIRHLLDMAKSYSDASCVIYACFEARNLLESIEFNMVIASVNEHEWRDAIEIAKKRDGIKKLGNKYHASFYHYNQFLKVLMKVNHFEENVGNLNMPVCHKLIDRTNEYVHLFNKDELQYESEFIQSGIKLIQNIENFLREGRILTKTGITIAGVTVRDFKGYTLDIYNQFISGKIKKENLAEVLIQGHINEHGFPPQPMQTR